MRVLLSGGGTAGHINPALAIAETVRKNDPDSEIAFVGIRGGKEEDLVPREGYPLYYVESMGIRRSLSLSNIRALWLALTSPYSGKTKKILREFRPDIVIGTGGYACWPIMAAAAREGIPTAVHESNALPGLAVRKLQKKVDRIWINFPATADALAEKEKVVRVGNPLRNGFGAVSKAEARKRLGISADRVVILSFGGSGGAEYVNRAAVELMRDFTGKESQILHLHAAGKRDFANTCSYAKELGADSAENCRIVDYIYEMPLWMSAADLLISRAGAMTLSELSLMHKACILIPSPYVADNHQYKNAAQLADAGAAVLVEEKTLQSGELTRAVGALLGERQKMRKMEEKIADFSDPDANRLIWQEIRRLVPEKAGK